ncbi:NAD(P)/FAD-dependent oxidoreductase [Acetivibrio mesophilus]|uniref:NAD(P)/FAD-dependent oxidoreductase n=1 Tax=Acetivibrio mesophilus TaxID=2487273 RepID=A0A4Q0I4J1_9FIRM|nr:NAD(P)/FAD-dependent oxidoreductase [Acetivibrio mesophilus]ODM25991.1 dehydrogenase [Clostridium sp. Bc-iso-3]RXE59214.1 NAD(P)/FAD-dependent oxidoreductase [Acetivibrio mesophilus]HHV29228.1 NAD(P)/FAD-dependent oxidoreductase [Clostridium sp.]
MKVAIIGGGLSGLSCAYELERHGISPVIFEKKGYIGDPYSHISALLEIQHRPIKDAIKYIKKNFNLSITPVNSVNTLTHISPNRKTVIKGNFGFFLKRGKDEDSLPMQLFSHLKSSKINFNTFGDIDPLAKEFDYVVVASGDTLFTNQLGCWHPTIRTYIRGAILLGDFDPTNLVMWINRDYCKSGYAYLTPFNNKKASIVLVVSDVNEKEVDHYWKVFLDYENLNYTIIEEFKQAHDTGFAYPHKVDNIYFVGNSGGAIDPFLGFGQLNSIEMGVMAARSIAEGDDYERLLKRVTKHNYQLYQMRKAFNTASNETYDFILAAIGFPGIRHLLYNSRFDVIKNFARLYLLKK